MAIWVLFFRLDANLNLRQRSKEQSEIRSCPQTGIQIMIWDQIEIHSIKWHQIAILSKHGRIMHRVIPKGAILALFRIIKFLSLIYGQTKSNLICVRPRLSSFKSLPDRFRCPKILFHIKFTFLIKYLCYRCLIIQ